ncbi:hypothetical protein SESBI_30068 [Sesbania bispinosa]|nr:hypothetical protein SESBI_30068 [Sesbania bispinosa]
MSAMPMMSLKTMAVEVTGGDDDLFEVTEHHQLGSPCDRGDGHEVCALAEKEEDIAITEDSNVTVESVEGGGEGRANAEGDECLGDLVSDEVRFADGGEDDGAGDVEEGLDKG